MGDRRPVRGGHQHAARRLAGAGLPRGGLRSAAAAVLTRAPTSGQVSAPCGIVRPGCAACRARVGRRGSRGRSDLTRLSPPLRVPRQSPATGAASCNGVVARAGGNRPVSALAATALARDHRRREHPPSRDRRLPGRPAARRRRAGRGLPHRRRTWSRAPTTSRSLRPSRERSARQPLASPWIGALVACAARSTRSSWPAAPAWWPLEATTQLVRWMPLARRRALAPGRIRLHRRVPARRGGPARRAPRHHPLGELRRCSPAPSRRPRSTPTRSSCATATSTPRPGVTAGIDLALGAGRGRPRRARSRSTPHAGSCSSSRRPGQPGAVQRPAPRCSRPSGRRCASCSPGSPTT